MIVKNYLFDSQKMMFLQYKIPVLNLKTILKRGFPQIFRDNNPL